MAHKPILSVIVPTLNEENYIGSCLAALNDQTAKREDYELIVSDSSSTDNTASIAKEYADKVVICKKIGAGYGRNYGAIYSNSDYLGFVDADTLVGEEWVEGVIQSLEKGVVASGPMKTYDAMEIRHKLFFKMWDLQTRTSIEIGKPLIPGFNFAVRKKEFELEKGFFNDNRVSEDIDLSLRLRKHGKAVFNKKMAVSTSSRRLWEIGVKHHIKAGAEFLLLGKETTWHNWRKKEFAAETLDDELIWKP